MKILYLFRDLPSIMYQWQHYHFIDEMAGYGCVFDIISPDSYNDLDSYYEAVLEKVEQETYDLIMTCLGDKYLSIEFVKKLKLQGIKTLLFCPDNLVVPYNHRSIAPLFDLVWLTSKETEYLFKKWNCNTVFLPYAANPDFLKPPSPPEKEIEKIRRVCFVGTPHGSRIKTINCLLQNNIPVTIYCSKQYAESRNSIQASTTDIIKKIWDKVRFPIGRKLLIGLILDKLKKEELDLNSEYLEIKDPVPITQLPEIYNSYYLILSFSEAESSAYLKHPVDIVNLRNFEIPMSGGIQFVRETNELKQYFTDRESVVFYKDSADMIKKAKDFLSSDDNTVLEIRRRSRIIAEENHTWMIRFKTVFSLLRLKERAND